MRIGRGLALDGSVRMLREDPAGKRPLLTRMQAEGLVTCDKRVFPLGKE